MTSVAFLSLALVLLVNALPAAQEVDWTSASSTTTTCRAGQTICVDLYNGCGAKTGGCYDVCIPTTYTIASCTAQPVWLDSETTSDVVSSTSAARVFGGVFAESFVNVKTTYYQRTSSASQIITSSDRLESSSTVESSIVEATITSLIPESTPVLVLPSRTTVLQLSTIEGTLHAETGGDPVAPEVTPPVDLSVSKAACGKKTKCYDYMTSMNAACPAVRYGGCIDVCKDPKTQFKPKCRAGRAAGKWLFF